MSDVDEVFQGLVDSYQHHSVLAAAFRQSERHYQQNSPEGYICHEVVRHAWMKLTPEQQATEMENLFNSWFITQMNIRKWLELEAKEPDGNTYLHHGDLDIIEDTLSGAVALGQFTGEEAGLDQVAADGMLSVPMEVLQRLVSEIELLQHRLAVRDGRPKNGGEA